MAAVVVTTELTSIKEVDETKVETAVGEKTVEVVKEAIEPIKDVEPIDAVEPVKVVEAVKEPVAVPTEEAKQSSTCACFGF